MSKKIGLSFWIGLVVTAVAAPTAFAANTELDFEIADELAHNTAAGTDTAYEWRMRPINMGFDSVSRDGVWADGRSYVKFTGTDASPNGHCLQLAFSPGLASPPSGVDVYVKDHNTNKYVYSFIPEDHAIRLWVNKNTGAAGSTLPWTIYILENDVDFGGDFNLDIRRIELGKAACATNPAGDPWINAGAGIKWPWVTIEGNSAAYTVTTGHF